MNPLTSDFGDAFWFDVALIGCCVVSVVGLVIYSFRKYRISMPALKPLLILFLAYWLVGMLFGAIYGLLHYTDPNSFTGLHNGSNFEFIYFSFVTLATLGYGDISPVSFWPRLLALWEAAVGIFFVAVLISIVVSHREPNRNA